MVPLTASAWGKTTPMQAFTEAEPAAGKGTELGHPQPVHSLVSPSRQLKSATQTHFTGKKRFWTSNTCQLLWQVQSTPRLPPSTLPITSGTLEQWLLPSRHGEGGGVLASCRVGLKFWIFIWVRVKITTLGSPLMACLTTASQLRALGPVSHLKLYNIDS